MTKIYVASSWRNTLQPVVVALLRSQGHDVYDFRNPVPGDQGFSWAEIDPKWENWTPKEYREALTHPAARRGYRNDITALAECDACLLVLPSGRSASWEFGYAAGEGKICAVYMPEKCEPELMYSDTQILVDTQELMHWGADL